MELNSDGKIQLEETINESIINGDANTTANVSDSTLDDSKDVTDKLETSGVESIVEPTAAVLSIDDPESGEIFKNHLICNNINNNHIPNKSAVAAAMATMDNNEPVQVALNKTTTNASAATNDNIATITITNTNSTAYAKANEANGDVVNNDSDTTKRLSNNSNTDAADLVGFFNPHTLTYTHIYI